MERDKRHSPETASFPKYSDSAEVGNNGPPRGGGGGAWEDAPSLSETPPPPSGNTPSHFTWIVLEGGISLSNNVHDVLGGQGTSKKNYLFVFSVLLTMPKRKSQFNASMSLISLPFANNLSW